MIDIKHECDQCSKDGYECLCEKHLEELKTEAYNKGFEDGLRDGREQGERTGYSKGIEEYQKNS